MADSGLAYIDVEENCDPFHLFEKWLEETKTHGRFNNVFFNLATSSRNGNVSNRTLVLRDFKENSLVFMTNGNSKKIQQIKNNPKIAACFFWNYTKNEKHVHRQVRVQGTVEQMSSEECLEYYKKEPINCQIRSHICEQDQKVEWESLKQKYEELLKEIKTSNKTLSIPEHEVAYRIIPNWFDFYYSWNGNIADRLQFTKQLENKWEFHHVAA